jgi:hypothetical protein
MSQVPPPAPPYGTAPTPGYQAPGAGGPPTSGKAIASLICGIIALGTCCMWFVSIPLGIVAVVLCVMGKSETDSGRASGRGLALTGMILGGIAAVLSLVVTVGGIQLGSFAERKAQEIEQKMKDEQQKQGQPTDTDTTDTTDTDTDTKAPPPAAPPPTPQ